MLHSLMFQGYHRGENQMNRIYFKFLYSILILLASAQAQGQVFACQYTDSTGLHFENGRWARKGFIAPKPFFLRLEEGRITQESAAIPLAAHSPNIVCAIKDMPQQGIIHTCSDYSSQLIFSPSTSSGATAQLLGSTSREQRRDSVTVSLFTCQSM
jgi:hypothetical protein